MVGQLRLAGVLALWTLTAMHTSAIPKHPDPVEELSDISARHALAWDPAEATQSLQPQRESDLERRKIKLPHFGHKHKTTKRQSAAATTKPTPQATTKKADSDPTPKPTSNKPDPSPTPKPTTKQHDSPTPRATTKRTASTPTPNYSSEKTNEPLASHSASASETSTGKHRGFPKPHITKSTSSPPYPTGSGKGSAYGSGGSGTGIRVTAISDSSGFVDVTGGTHIPTITPRPSDDRHRVGEQGTTAPSDTHTVD